MEANASAIADALPGYIVGAEVGRGAWGIVLEGTHRQLDRKVAIKQLPEAFASTPEVRVRFEEEARVLAKLSHPHIVQLYDYRETEGLCLLVMEWLPGRSVWDRMAAAGLTPEAACATVMATCAGLEFAHQKGVLHRDIKPENLIFDGDGILKVTDFGIAKVIGGRETLASRAGEILGTPAYMSPEQVLGGDLGPQTDVYSVGVMLYELLAGRLPFPIDPDPIASAYLHVNQSPEPLSKSAPQVSSQLAEVTMRALSKSASDRQASAEELGLAVARAAAAAWGSGWLERSGVTVLAGGKIAEAAREVTSPAVQSVQAPVRATLAGHRPEAGSALGFVPSEVRPVNAVAELPSKPVAEIGVATLGLLLAVVVAIVASGRPLPGGGTDAGAVTIAGVDPAAVSLIDLDVGTPVEVGLSPGIAEALGTERAVVSLTVAGIPVDGISVPIIRAGAGSVAEADLSGAKFLAPSVSTLTVELERDGDPAVIASRVKSDQPLIQSIPALAAIVLGLFIFANGEATFKPMRRRKKGAVGVVALGAMGALLGLVVQIVTWLTLSREPSLLSIAGSVLLSSAAGVALGLAGLKYGRRHRPTAKRVR